MTYSSTVGGAAMGMVEVPRRVLPLRKTFFYSNKKGTRYSVPVIKANLKGFLSAA